MVRRVAVCVLWDVQKDEEVLPEVVGHSRKPGETVVRKAEQHHLSGSRTRRLDELRREWWRCTGAPHIWYIHITVHLRPRLLASACSF